MTDLRRLQVLELGRVPYADAHALQRRLADRRIARELGQDLLLLLEHDRTVTLGRGSRASSLPLSVPELEGHGVTVVEVERGGDVTWHGPGQLVGYPILDLTGHRQDLHWYLRAVEEALILALRDLGLTGSRRPGLTGVWIEDRKVASIGIHVRQWVTTHGFALNLTNDLADFGLIVPCGIPDVRMTTVARERDVSVPPAALGPAATAAVTRAFGAVFGLTPVATTLPEALAGGTAARSTA